ncbi:alginate lyase family protein [Microbacterium gorillae]|uniref:alginate lyase family protein n=1 Tax=Microbacterium gorillae TaxID=1231063 RepID=UPI00058C2445|nr:alginate lyase family protein [Microbacterium gorillae]
MGRATASVPGVRCGRASAVLLVVLLLLGLGVPAQASGSSALPAVEPVTSSAGFTHPGVFVGLSELTASKAHVRAGDAPWITIFRQLTDSTVIRRGAPDFASFAAASVYPSTVAEHYENSRCSSDESTGCITYCGSFNNPDVGCSDELADARAVYGQALMYWYTDDRSYAQRAIAILNAYAEHFAGNHGSNGPLMTAWIAEMMIRGAELIRYTYTPAAGEVAFDVTGFSTMLRDVFVARLQVFSWADVNGNWSGSAADGLMNAGVFLDDRAIYEEGVALWRARVPTYLYLSSDGALPVAPPGSTEFGTDTAQKRINLACWWLNDKADSCRLTPREDPGPLHLQNGQSQESCRDFGHVSLGIAGMVSAAETAYLQGDDLYGEEQHRIMTGISYLVQVEQHWRKHHAWPRGFCKDVSGLVATGLTTPDFQAEVAYNAYAVRAGVAFRTIVIPGYSDTYPNGDPLAAYIALKQTDRNVEGFIDAWDTLTHHAVPTGAAVKGERSGVPLIRYYPVIFVALGLVVIAAIALVVRRLRRR